MPIKMGHHKQHLGAYTYIRQLNTDNDGNDDDKSFFNFDMRRRFGIFNLIMNHASLYDHIRHAYYVPFTCYLAQTHS